MSNIILAYPLSDSADLSGSVAPASMPVSNLKAKQPTEVFRILDPTSGFINIDNGGLTIDLICLLAHSASTRAYVRVRASNVLNDVESAPDYDSGNLPARSHQTTYATDDANRSLDLNNFILKLDNPVSYRYWRIDFIDSVSAFVDIGRLYMSLAWSPNVNADYGLPIGWTDLSKLPRASSGQTVPLRKKKFRYAEFALTFLSEEEALDNLFELDRLRGTTEDVLFIKDISNQNQLQRQTIYGRMAVLQPASHANFLLYSKTFRIEEL